MVQLLLADQRRIKPTCAPLQNLLNSLSLSHLHYARAATTSNSSRHPSCLHLPSLIAQSLAGQWSKNGDERTELLSSISPPGSAKRINKQQKLRSFKLATPPTKSHVCRPYFTISLNPVSSIPTRFTSVAGQFTTPPTRPTRTSVHGTAKLGARLQISTPCNQGVLLPSRTKPWFRASSSHKEARPCPLSQIVQIWSN
ncbi:hypothetical protein L3X38_015488 [Prunus dulcis]|uniref:Uncharacterized protein n=1 Tax=Prunus dulcis TaxID=3755 RepID=A0AAD4W467_PRUDU|nr:hypothetical protein L3X38_015488 [Prunus dulcis]